MPVPAKPDLAVVVEEGDGGGIEVNARIVLGEQRHPAMGTTSLLSEGRGGSQEQRGDDRYISGSHVTAPFQPAPNGSRLSCGRPAHRRKDGGRREVLARARHNGF